MMELIGFLILLWAMCQRWFWAGLFIVVALTTTIIFLIRVGLIT